MTSYFDYTTDRIEDGSIARAATINVIFDEISAAFDKLPSETVLKLGTVNYGIDTGAADAYVVTLPYVPAGYTDGMQVLFKADNANTGAATINVNSLGIKDLMSQSGAALSSGDIAANKMVLCVYNGVSGDFEIISVIGDAAIRAALAIVSALLAASGVKVSANDTVIGVLNGKLVAGTGISFTENNDGGDETFTIAGVNASSTVKGVASFNADEFNISSGAVSLNSAQLDFDTFALIFL